MASVYEAAKRCLQQQRHELAGSLLYLDAGAAEAVAACVGLKALHELGPASVCDLGAATPADLATAALLSGGPVRRVAFLVTSLLADAEAAVLAAARLHPAAAQFTVLCSVSQAAHHDEVAGMYSSACYAAFAAAWQQQLNEARRAAGGAPCSVALAHSPLPLCPLSSAAFVLPPSAAAATAPRSGGLPAGCSAVPAAGAGDDSDDNEPGGGGGSSGSTGLTLLAHALVDAAAALGHRPEAFALGPCSRAVCRAMAFVPPLAQDAPPAALVLVDRALDPVSPAQHADLLAQRMYSALQQQAQQQEGQQEGQQQEQEQQQEQQQQRRGAEQAVALQQPQSQPAAGCGGGGRAAAPAVCAQVQMPSLDQPSEERRAAGGGDGGGRGAPSLLPGSLRHPNDAEAERWLEFLLSRRGRDGPLFVRKWLREACRKGGVAPAARFKPGSISAEELRALADTLRRSSAAAAARHAPLLQLAEAAAAALEGSVFEGWEALAREERALLFACGESREAAASHLAELCQLAAGGGAADGAALPLQLADVALLVLAAYCWLPAFLPWYAAGEGGAAPALQPQQEAELADALVEAAMASGTSGTPSSTDALTSHSAGGADEAWSLGRLCRRAAAARRAAGAGEQPSPGGSGGGDEGWGTDEGWESPGDVEAASAASSGGDGGEAAEQLPALRLEARDAVLALLGRMRQLAAFRTAHLKAAKHLAAMGDDGAPRHTPLLAQLADAVLRDAALPDLHAGATSLSGLLRSGLGRFGLQAGPKPSDCPTVILFVVGGLSIAELHAVLQAVDERAAAAQQAQQPGARVGAGPGAAPRPPPRVLVGATALLQPGELCGHLFGDL